MLLFLIYRKEGEYWSLDSPTHWTKVMHSKYVESFIRHMIQIKVALKRL